MINTATFIMRDQVNNQIANIMGHYKTDSLFKSASQLLILVISITAIGLSKTVEN